ncbi:hypothetical protein SH580_05065 [Coraliomargarita algicola]|uniref:Uncharacterized protein n=1 Tax=Coraliomargarita algicola TaxID=3092156 RepID=A0ABZ0RQ23_9BACT|nr:hypothetical protein [Coraliomargarita sp. J2-16]WPJ97075.1 hypothetical protein SH580_05065 [Coraliomargarita sp. J2-16]
MERAAGRNALLQAIHTKETGIEAPALSRGSFNQHIDVPNYFPEMNQAIVDAYDAGKLFSENATPWAMPAQSIDLTSLQT